MKILARFILAIFILFSFVIANSNENQKVEWKGEIEYENEVKVIKNPNEPLYGEITLELEEDLSIGNEEDENYMFYRIGMPVVDSEGNILVLDGGNYRIQKYDKDGKYLQSIGRQGQGPGEFEMPSTLYLDSDDNIYVWDMGRRKTHKFNTTCLNSADVSPGMEIVPKSSFNMIRFGHGNKETSPLCIPVYVPYGMDTEVQV